ncbi:MAG: VWA domain-containing protein [Melioribacteraceae bacterium]|nr:VWA domain-containing protein [Melioribacteraceae bacterium]
MTNFMRKIKIALAIIFLIMNSCSFDGNTENPTSPNNSVIQIQSPKDGTKGIQVYGIDLSWTSTAQIGTVFQVFLEPTSNNGTLPSATSWLTTPKGNGLTTTKFFTGKLSYLTWYAWRVRALLPNGTWTDSPTYYFQTEDIPQTSSYFIKVHDYESHINIDHDIPILFQVVDASGNGITGLKLSDFEILEDGEPLRESNLSFVNQKTENILMPVHILIDNSSSVTDNSILQKMKADATSIVTFLSSPAAFISSFYVYEFSETLKPKGGQIPTQLTAQQAINEISNIQNGVRSTDFYGAVSDVANKLISSLTVKKVNQPIMIVLSDGDDTAGKRTLAEATNAVAGKRVYTIGYAGDLREDILKMIGVSGYFNASNGNVTQFLTSIREYLNNYSQSFYLLTVTSPKRGFRSHTITIRLRGSLESVNVTYQGW